MLHYSVDKKPVAVWNVTRRCNLHCVHCYSDSRDRAYPGELSTTEGKRLLNDMSDFGVPAVLFSGGEPLTRPDLFQLAEHARGLGLRCVLSTNGTLIDDETAQRIADTGFSYVGISFDGIDAAHDRVRGKQGAYEEALSGLRRVRTVGVRTGLRFTVHRMNLDQLPAIFDLLETEAIDRCCVYHLAYAGRGEKMRRYDLLPKETRQVVEYVFSRAEDFHHRAIDKEILTVDNHTDNALLYLRVAERQPERAEEVREMLAWNGGNQSGVAIACVDPTGDVHADQFSWNYTLGSVRQRTFSEIWGDTSDERMALLKDRKGKIEGRCRSCRFFDLCNGNLRARAESYFDSYVAPDPACYLTDEEIGIEPGSPESDEAGRWPVPVQEE